MKAHPFLQALLWSFGLHLVLLGIFSISSFFLPTFPSSEQIDVQLDLSSSIPLASLELTGRRPTRDSLLEGCFLKNSSLIESAIKTCSPSDEVRPLVRSYTPPELPWAAEDILSIDVLWDKKSSN